MFKKVAILLILVLVCNMTLWGDYDWDFTLDKKSSNGSYNPALGIGVLLVLILLFAIVPDKKVKTDSPDDEKKMTSMESEELINTSSFNNLKNVLQHVEAGVTQNNDVYVGLRFQY